jgi:hypothetical protein
MSARTRPPTRRRIAALLAATVAASVATLAAVPADAATVQASSTATKQISYLGRTFTVPDSWSVVNLAQSPTACVRLDRDTVYLGAPRAQESCPDHAVGRADTLVLQPGSATAAPGMTQSAVEQQVTAEAPGIEATATYGAAGPAAVLDVLASAGLTSSTPISTHATQRSAVVRSAALSSGSSSFTGEAVDACEDPSSSELSAWSSSPYRGVGMYIGGANMGCAQPNLTASALSSEAAAGWHFYLLYVGVQGAGNTCGCSTITSPVSQANAAAENAVNIAAGLGFAAGTPIFYDMEPYGSSATSDVIAFESQWTAELHALGYQSGVYGSISPEIDDIMNNLGSFNAPDDIDFADWNGSAGTSDSNIPSADWDNHNRIHQYTGATNVTYGGVEIQVDQDYMDIAPPTATSGSSLGSASSSSSTVVQPNGTVSHFTRDANGDVWDSSITAAGVINAAYNLTTNTPYTPVTSSEPTAAVTASGGIDIITTAGSGDVINTPISSTGALGPTYDLTANAGKSGGIPATPGTPSIVAEANGTVVVVDRAASGNVWSIAWSASSIGPAYDWTANSPHTPSTDGNPTAAVTPAGGIDIISTNAADGDVINSPWNANGSLGPTYDLTANAGKSGGIPATPYDASIAVQPNGTAVVVDRASDGEVWSIAWGASSIGPAYDWTANNPHTPKSSTTPALALTAGGGIDIITTTAGNGDVVNSPWNANGVLGPTYDLTANAGNTGGIAAASGNTSIVVQPDGTATVFDAASDGEVWSISWGSSSIGPAYDWTANYPHTPEAD